MKWFKHNCDSLDSSFEQELIHRFKGNGYLVYYGIKEMVCKEANYENMDGKGEFSARLIKQKLHVSERKVEEILHFCSTKGKLFFNKTEQNFNIKIPNILEIRDNHSKNLPVADKQLAPKKREVRSKKLEVEEPKHIVEKKDSRLLGVRFEKIWEDYPPGYKDGKKAALKHFRFSVVTDKDWEDIQKALVNYKAHIEHVRATGFPERSYKNGSSWFNNWRDWVEFEVEKTETGESPLSQAHEGHGEFVDKAIRAIEYSITVSKEAGDKPDVKGIVQEIIEDALEDEKEALRIIYYNASYTNTKPESLK